MIRPVVLTEDARRDIEEAGSWYRRHSDVLARDFFRSLLACLDGIEEFPERHTSIHRNVRRALLQRFPYTILYVPGGDVTVVIGCFHVRRNPGGWQGRRT